jgi:hypothetical protein
MRTIPCQCGLNQFFVQPGAGSPQALDADHKIQQPASRRRLEQTHRTGDAQSAPHRFGAALSVVHENGDGPHFPREANGFLLPFIHVQ